MCYGSPVPLPWSRTWQQAKHKCSFQPNACWRSLQPRSELLEDAEVPLKQRPYRRSKGCLARCRGMSSPWLQLLDCLCQWVWTHPPWWQPKSPMQFGSLPGMGRCVQVRGAVEPSPGGDARVSGRGGLGWGLGWEGDWGGGRGRRRGTQGTDYRSAWGRAQVKRHH